MASIVTAVSVASLVVVHRVRGVGDDILIGDSLGSGEIGMLATALAAIALLVLTGVTLGRFAARRPGRVGRVILGGVTAVVVLAVSGAGLLGFAGHWLTGAAYTQIEGVAGRQDLVASERGFLLLMSGVISVREGVILTPVARYSADDGFFPFRRGAYRVVSQSADEVVLTYDFNSEGHWPELVVPLR